MHDRMAKKVSDAFAEATRNRDMQVLKGDAERIRQYGQVEREANAARDEEKRKYDLYRDERIIAEIKQLQIERAKPKRDFKPKGLGNDQNNSLTAMARKNVDQNHDGQMKEIDRIEKIKKNHIVQSAKREKRERLERDYARAQQRGRVSQAFKRSAGPTRTRQR